MARGSTDADNAPNVAHNATDNTRPCGTCGGSGKVWRYDNLELDPHHDTVDCPDCKEVDIGDTYIDTDTPLVDIPTEEELFVGATDYHTMRLILEDAGYQIQEPREELEVT